MCLVMALKNTASSTSRGTIAASASLTGLVDTICTMCFWINPTSVANALLTVMGHSVTDGGWEVFKQGADGTVLQLQGFCSGTDFQLPSATGFLQVDTWIFAAVVVNRADTTVCKWYRGLPSGALTQFTGTVVSGANAPASDATASLKVLNNGPSFGFPGSLAILRIWNRLLTYRELQQEFISATTVNMAGNVLSLDLGAYGTSGLIDKSNYGNHGTITGLTWEPTPNILFSRQFPFKRILGAA